MGYIHKLNTLGKVRSPSVPLPQEEESTLLGKLTSSVFDLLDVPQNVLFSGILAAQQYDRGETEAAKKSLINAVKTLLPFVPAREVEFSEIGPFGEDEYWKNLAGEIIVDPLNFVPGLGRLTKLGRAGKRLTHLKNEAKLAKQLGLPAEEVLAAQERAFEARRLLNVETAKAGADKRTRSIISLGLPLLPQAGELHIGDAKKVGELAAKLNLFKPFEHKIFVDALNRNQNLLIKAARENAEQGDIWYHGTPRGFENIKASGRTGAYGVYGSKTPKIAHRFVSHVAPGEFTETFTGYGAFETPNIRPFKVRGKILRKGTKEFDAIVDELPILLSHSQETINFQFYDDILEKYANIKNEDLRKIPEINAFIKSKGIDKLPLTILNDFAEHMVNITPYSEQIKAIANGKHTWRVWEHGPIRHFLQGKGYSAVEMTETAGDTIRVFDEKDIINYGTPEFYGDKFTKLFAKNIALQKQLQQTNTGRFTPPVFLRSFIRNLESKFRHTRKDDFIQTGAEFLKSNIAKERELLGEDLASALESARTIAKQHGVSEAEQLMRLLGLGQLRHLRTGQLPDYATKASKEAEKLQKLFAKKEAKIKASKKLGDAEKLERLNKLHQKAYGEANAIKAKYEALRIRDTAFVNNLKDVTPEEWQFVDQFIQPLNKLVAAETAVGLKSESLTSADGLLSYVRRLPTEKAMALKKANSKKYSLILNEFNLRLQSAHQRKLYPEKTIEEINKLVREDFGIDFDFFDNNIVNALMDRRRQSYQNIERARYINTMIEEFAIPKGVGRGYSVRRFLDDLGLDKNNPIYKKYQGMKIPFDKKREILGIDDIIKNSVFNNAPNLNKLMKLTERVNNVFRPLLTVVSPSFHFRNFVSNTVLNKVAGISFAKQLAISPEVLRLQVNKLKGTLDPEQKKLWDELVRYGITGKGQFAEVQQDIQKAYGQGKIESGLQALRRGSGYIEDHNRIAHYLIKRREGASELEAMRSVNKYLFDYSVATNFEREYMKPTFLFYTWMRNNIPLMIKTTLTDPRLVNVYENITGLNQDDVPSYLKGSRGFAISPTEAVGSIGVPFEDLNLLNVADADPNFFDQLARLSDKVLTRASPVFRIPIELAKGETLYTKKNLNQLSFKELVKNFTPFGRIVREGEKLIDPDEESRLMSLLDVATGLRTYPLDPSRVKIDKLKRAALSTGRFTRSGFLVLPSKKYSEDEFTKQQFNLLQTEIRKLQQRKRL